MVARNLIILALTGLAATTSAVAIRKRDGSGSPYDCGCASRKQKLVCLGADTEALAIAFQETGSALSGTAYAYGDNKVSDAANFGLFKNNWYMIRTACSQFKGQSADQYHNGAVLNTDDAAAIKCLGEQKAMYGANWYAGQRDGSSGIQNPGTADIQGYQQGVQFIQSYLEQGHMTDNMATYYNTHGI